MLALLQRDGRLIDFFSEDITAYQDAQIGAAVRELHANCRKALEQYVKLEPILAGEEDRPVTVDAGFDPSSIKLIGNVTGQPPLRGLLRHRGWRVTEVKLPPMALQDSGRSVVAPAEVEIAEEGKMNAYDKRFSIYRSSFRASSTRHPFLNVEVN
jgi:hypothetical protein